MNRISIYTTLADYLRERLAPAASYFYFCVRLVSIQLIFMTRHAQATNALGLANAVASRNAVESGKQPVVLLGFLRYPDFCDLDVTLELHPSEGC